MNLRGRTEAHPVNPTPLLSSLPVKTETKSKIRRIKKSQKISSVISLHPKETLLDGRAGKDGAVAS